MSAREAGPVTVSTAPRWLRAMATFLVLVVGLVAAINSYAHMRHLGLRFGEGELRASLSPLAVDGMAAVATLTMLTRQRSGKKPGWLPWAALLLGLAASLWANMVAAQPDWGARLWAAIPPLFLLISIELLLSGVRATTRAVAWPDDPGPVPSAESLAIRPPPLLPEPPQELMEATASAQPPQAFTDASKAPNEPAPTPPASQPRSRRPERSLEDLLAGAQELQRELGRRPGVPALKKRLGVGQSKATEIRDLLPEDPQP